MPRKRKGPQGRRPVFWWSDKIADLRRQSLALRRRYQACIRRVNQPGVQEARFSYIAVKWELRITIREAKNKCWADLCAQVDTDPRGRPYKLVMKKLGGRNPATSSRGREAVIADALFPAAPVTDWGLAPSPAVHNIFQAFDPILNTLEFTRVIPEFRSEELSRAVKRLAPGKAAGPSGIPNEIQLSSAQSSASSTTASTR